MDEPKPKKKRVAKLRREAEEAATDLLSQIEVSEEEFCLIGDLRILLRDAITSEMAEELALRHGCCPACFRKAASLSLAAELSYVEVMNAGLGDECEG
jgi:hypothetical protein